MVKKAKADIIQCIKCRYYRPIGNTVDGLCTVSPYRAYRKWSQSCEKAVRKEKR